MSLLAGGVVPLLVAVPLLMSVPVFVGELPAPLWANADVASIVPAAVSASSDIHVFIAVLVFIKVLLVLLRVADARFSWPGAGPPPACGVVLRRVALRDSGESRQRYRTARHLGVRPVTPDRRHLLRIACRDCMSEGSAREFALVHHRRRDGADAPLDLGLWTTTAADIGFPVGSAAAVTLVQ
jgi:hypothetical protein